jgi:hypothetical protein
MKIRKGTKERRGKEERKGKQTMKEGEKINSFKYSAEKASC